MDSTAIIKELGGTQAVAKLCEVSKGAVSQWKKGKGIPKARLMFLRLKRPDVFEKQKARKKKAA